MSGAALSIRSLTMKFGGLVAIDDVSIDIEPGRIHAIIGPNGAGKSTLFNCISGFYRPSQGAISLHGENLLARPRHDMAKLGVARTFQNLELFGGLTVLENIRFGMYARSAAASSLGFSRGDERGEIEAADELIERLGLARHRNALARSLDFGSQKLVELARALAMKPRLLLLDEPAAGLRNHAIRTLDETLVRLAREEGVTIVLVEHVMALVMSISHRITVLNFGKVIAEGEPRQIREDHNVVSAYLGRRRVDA